MKIPVKLHSSLPKDVNSICANDNLASTDLLFGGDLDKALRAARKSSKLSANKRGDHLYRPYQQQQKRNFPGKPFLGQNPTFDNNSFRRGKGGKPPARGFGKLRKQ